MRQLIFIVGLFALSAGYASAATLSIDASRTMTVGDIVTARVVVDSKGVAINNAEATLSFPSEVLTVVSVSKSGSIFSLWVEEPSFSNTAGSVTFNGGVPNPGFSGSAGSVMLVTFQAKRAGTATLSLGNAAVRANDGLGTNVFTGASGAQITVTAPETPLSPKIAQPVYAATDITSIPLSSPTHPDDTGWYSNTTPTISWQLPSDTLSVQTGIGPLPDGLPTVTYTPPISEKTVESLEDGIWYFKVRARTERGWSAVSTYRLNIDTVAPEIQSHEFFFDETRGVLVVHGTARDEQSGVTRYDIVIDSEAPLSVPADELTGRPYLVAVHGPGFHTVKLIAYDAADNSHTVTGSFIAPISIGHQELVNLGPITITLTQAFLIMLCLTFLSTIAALIGWYRLWKYQHRRHRPALKPHRDILHRCEDYHSVLTQNLDFLEALEKKRELTKEERILKKRIEANIAAFEKLLKKLFDQLHT